MKNAILFGLLTILMSCSKSDNTITCNDASVTFISNSTNKYKLEIDGVNEKDIPAKDIYTKNLKIGNHTFKVTQLEGFVLFPTIKEETVKLICDETLNWRFP